MARPQKERVICAAPKYRCFAPTNTAPKREVVLTADEVEVLRLHDLEHMTQLDVSRQMLIARTTVTLLLNNAHAKLADAIVNGRQIRIDDGNCRICEIGASCPKAVEACCEKKHRCCASCRYEREQTKNSN